MCCLGGAGVAFWHDGPRSTLRRMLEVEIAMVGSLLLAALQTHNQLDSSKPLPWPLLIEFSLLFVGSSWAVVSGLAVNELA